MKVAVSSVENHLDALVDPRFGRAAYFLIVETDSLNYEMVPNPNVNAMGGAGVQSAQLVINKGAKAVLTGKCGPNAFHVFDSAGIKIYEGVEGTVRNVVKALQDNQIYPSKEPSGVPVKSGGNDNI